MFHSKYNFLFASRFRATLGAIHARRSYNNAIRIKRLLFFDIIYRLKKNFRKKKKEKKVGNIVLNNKRQKVLQLNFRRIRIDNNIVFNKYYYCINII